MEKVRKAGLWMWEVKERVVLALMVLLLGYRVYTLVNAQDEEKNVVLAKPGPMQIDDRPPPPVPNTPTPEPVIRLVRRTPFAYVPPQTRVRGRGDDSSSDKDSDVRVLRIQEVTTGVYRAQIQISAGGARKMIGEGESFESYQLQSIDPDTGCCIIYSENSGSDIERCIEEN